MGKGERSVVNCAVVGTCVVPHGDGDETVHNGFAVYNVPRDVVETDLGSLAFRDLTGPGGPETAKEAVADALAFPP